MSEAPAFRASAPRGAERPGGWGKPTLTSSALDGRRFRPIVRGRVGAQRQVRKASRRLTGRPQYQGTDYFTSRNSLIGTWIFPVPAKQFPCSRIQILGSPPPLRRAIRASIWLLSRRGAGKLRAFERFSGNLTAENGSTQTGPTASLPYGLFSVRMVRGEVPVLSRLSRSSATLDARKPPRIWRRNAALRAFLSGRPERGVDS